MNTKQADTAIAALRAESAKQGQPVIYQSDLDIDDEYLHGTLDRAETKIQERFYWLLREHGTELYVPVPLLNDGPRSLTYTIICARFWTNDPKTLCYTYDTTTGLQRIDRDDLIKRIIQDCIGHLEPAVINAAIKAADEDNYPNGTPKRVTFRVVGARIESYTRWTPN